MFVSRGTCLSVRMRHASMSDSHRHKYLLTRMGKKELEKKTHNRQEGRKKERDVAT